LELEAKKMSLEKDLLQKTDEQAQTSEQLTQTNKQKEELITRLTNLEDNYQKGEMLREQFKLKLQQSTQNIERLEKLNKTTEDKLEDALKESQQLREEFGKEKELMK
jgi:chromosome segregation ATPase